MVFRTDNPDRRRWVEICIQGTHNNGRRENRLLKVPFETSWEDTKAGAVREAEKRGYHDVEVM